MRVKSLERDKHICIEYVLAPYQFDTQEKKIVQTQHFVVEITQMCGGEMN